MSCFARALVFHSRVDWGLASCFIRAPKPPHRRVSFAGAAFSGLSCHIFRSDRAAALLAIVFHSRPDASTTPKRARFLGVLGLNHRVSFAPTPHRGSCFIRAQAHDLSTRLFPQAVDVTCLIRAELVSHSLFHVFHSRTVVFHSQCVSGNCSQI